MSHDLVIRNGTLVDGSGLAPYRADVAVDGDRITEIGRVPSVGREEIDAEGHVVSPGFVDGHTHMDAQVMWDAFGTPSCWHGITTVVMGNCGFTLAPVRSDKRSLVVRNLERAEDIDAAALAAGIDWSWETFPEYLDAVEARPKGINYAAYVGHSALRTWAMGERAFEEKSTDDDLDLMEGQLRDSLRAGAIGFTTSRSSNHETSDDRPVASRLASWDEVCRLVGVMGELGTGVLEIAPSVDGGASEEERASGYGLLRDLAVATRVPMTLPSFVDQPGPGSVLGLLDSAAAAGGRIFGQSHSRGVSIVLSFLTHMPFDRLPVWRDVRALEPEAQLRKLQDPATRERLIYEATHGDYGRAIGAEARKPDYDKTIVMDSPIPPNRTVSEMAAARGIGPVELMLDLAVESGLGQLFVQTAGISNESLLAAMKHPRTVMTFSDAGAHVSQITDVSIQTYFLAHWVRNRQAFTLEEAVRMLTLVPATAWGFADRGLVREGFVADLNVFDAERVGPELPTVEQDLPAGATRLVQKASGFLATIVSGTVVLRDGEHTGALSGRLLRGPLAS